MNCTPTAGRGPIRSAAGPSLGGCILAHHEADRVAGEVEESERDERDHCHDDGGLQNAAKDEGEHGPGEKCGSILVPAS
jgi:hypothetical protein